MTENNKEKKFVCQYCDRDDFKNKGAKGSHENWCKNNPDKTQANNIRKKMSEEKKGEKNHMFGKKRPKFSKQMLGEKNPMWRKFGKDAPHFGNRNKNTLVWNDWIYQRIHYTIRQLKPKPEKCETCEKKTQKFHCSYNLPHFESNPLYYSLNPNHYVWKCIDCHRKYDNNAFWSKWSEQQIREYTENLKILKKNWPKKGFRIERNILKKRLTEKQKIF